MIFRSGASLVKLLAGTTVLFTLANCVPFNMRSNLIIDGLIFRNQTKTTIYNVQVHVKKTSAFAECSPVLADAECTTTFQAVPYRGNAITVRWEQDSRSYSTEEFHASIPAEITPNLNAKVLVNINPSGGAAANLVQFDQ